MLPIVSDATQKEGAGRTGLVTGASAGIGRAFAEVLAARGYHVVLVARRSERLEAAAEELRNRYRIEATVITADLASPDAVARLAADLDRRRLVVDVLVNNAGYGVPGLCEQSPWARHEDSLRVMLTAVCELTYRVLPGMIGRRWGRIINVASLAGHLPPPAGHTLYAATKAFLVRFSEALHLEHVQDGVHTCAVCPGFTCSEFHDVNGTRSTVSRVPAVMWMDAPTVAAQGYAAVTKGQAVHINGRINRTIAWLARVMPQGIVRPAVTGSWKRFKATEQA
jgi:uncharacterized protein